jgi:hypothetical protein
MLTRRLQLLGERSRVRLCTQLVQQPGRALDVGEEEGDDAGRELGARAEIMWRT